MPGATCATCAAGRALSAWMIWRPMLKAIHSQENRDAADRKARAIVEGLRAGVARGWQSIVAAVPRYRIATLTPSTYPLLCKQFFALGGHSLLAPP